ncbi:TetR/AcrR family transcriptional regulator [Enterococcus alishanensis]
MPKSTFKNLPTERQEYIRGILLDIFYAKPLGQVKVSEIVSALNMSRGIFYKYFEDLNEAYDYLIHYYAGIVHGEIIGYITHQKSDYFKGIENFLLSYIDLEETEPKYRQLALLTQNSYLFSYRSPMAHGMDAWTAILQENHFNIQSEAESVSFLYFSMKLVIDSLTDMLANDWSKEELIHDYRFKARWLTEGLQQKNSLK